MQGVVCIYCAVYCSSEWWAEILTSVATNEVLNPMWKLFLMSHAITNHGMPASLTMQNATMEHVINTNKWLGQSKRLANRLVEKRPENSFPQRQLEYMPLELEGPRSLTDKHLELLRSAKSAANKKAQTFVSTRCRSNVMQG